MTPANDASAKPPVIAIDGPGASGKTTVGLGLARRLDYLCIDTGVMYRAVTVLALERDVGLDDRRELTRLAEEISITFGEPASPETPAKPFVDGRDLSNLVHAPEVDRAVSQVSAVAGVRTALVALQRRMAEQGGVVMVGRDIGTVVLPKADLKVFLEASAEVRARRRHEQRSESSSFDRVLADLQRRDRIDSQRAISPLTPAADARRVDTDHQTIEQVIDTICKLLGAG